MIDRVKIQNYKSLKDVEITFDSRLTVLVGENGSGKSSVLKCIQNLCDVLLNARNSIDGFPLLQPSIHATSNVPGLAQVVEFTVRRHNVTLIARYRAIIDFNAGRGQKLKNSLEISGNTSDGKSFSFDDIPSELLDDDLNFAKAQYVSFKPEDLAVSTVPEMSPPRFEANGRGLSSQMAHLKLHDDQIFARAVDTLRVLVPQVVDIRINRIPTVLGGPLGDMILFDLPNRKGVPASQMSDGTLYALGLIVKILDPQRPKTLLIDDIDHGFHPKAQTQLVELIKKLLEEFPDLQIIATSHSPYILSGLDWNQVRVLHLREDGTSVIRPLTDHPKYEKWHDTMTPGEFWSHAGEEWVVETEKSTAEIAA